MPKRKRPQPTSTLTRGNQFLAAINTVVAALDNATRSETAVFDAFVRELKKLDLHGAISMLSETGDMLVVKALVMPDNMNKAVHALEKIINIKSVGYSYRLAAAHIDREVLETNQALYLENNYQKLLQVFPDLGFLGRQALRPFSGQPGIVAPITLDGKVQGTLYLASAQLQPEDISIISIFANQIANALQEARLLQNIQQTEAQYRRLFETANDAILVLDVLTERIISANPKALALTGYTLEELYTLSLETLFPLNQFSAQVRLLKNDLRHRAFITEAQVQNRGGSPVAVEISATLFELNGRVLLQGFMRDITEQKHIESLQTAVYQIATLANSDINLNDLYRSIHLGVGSLMEAKNFYIALYDKVEDKLMLPYFVDEKDNYDGQPYPAGKGLTELVIRSGLPRLVNDEDHEALCRSGQVVPVGPASQIWLGVPLKKNEETFGAIVVQSYEDRGVYTEQEKQFLVFVSGQIAAAIERKRAETERMKLTAKLEQHVSMLNAVLSSTPESFYIYDLNGRFLFVSDSAAAVLGISSQEMIGKTWQELGYRGEAIERFMAEQAQVLATGETLIRETAVIENDETRYFEYSLNPVHNKQHEFIMLVTISREITERKRAEEALRHTQKIESLGILAGGVAHDFNNLLVAMLSQNSLALAKLSPGHAAYAHIEKAVKAAERAAELTRQLLAYSGRGQFALERLDLNTIIMENRHLLEVAVPPKVTLTLNLGKNLPLIDADPGQMQQVVMNLILNAAEAFEERPGTILVNTKPVTILAQNNPFWHLTNQEVVDGDYVLISVQDDGVGMDAETLDRIFDPFYTTKFTGRGLGLAAVLGIVRGHQGGLHVESQPNVGTTFEIVFPVSSTQIAAPSEESVDYSAASGVVLVIDDEAPVLEAVQDILELQGIETLTAANGRLGVQTYQAHQDRIDLVLLDWSMPEMNGAETLEALVAINPDVRVILTSGYSETEIADKSHFEQLAGYLQKPYSLATLTDEISRHLPHSS